MWLLGILWSLSNSDHNGVNLYLLLLLFVNLFCYFKRHSKCPWQSKKILESETCLLLSQKLLILCICGSIDPGVYSTLVEWLFPGHVMECKEKHRLVFSSRCSWLLVRDGVHMDITNVFNQGEAAQQVPSSWRMGAGLQLWRNDSIIFSLRESWSHNTYSRWVVWGWKSCLNLCVCVSFSPHFHRLL